MGLGMRGERKLLKLRMNGGEVLVLPSTHPRSPCHGLFESRPRQPCERHLISRATSYQVYLEGQQSTCLISCLSSWPLPNVPRISAFIWPVLCCLWTHEPQLDRGLDSSCHHPAIGSPRPQRHYSTDRLPAPARPARHCQLLEKGTNPILPPSAAALFRSEL